MLKRIVSVNKLMKAKNIISHVVELRERFSAPMNCAVVGGASIGAALIAGSKPGSVSIIAREAISAVDLPAYEAVIWVLHPGEALGDEAEAVLEKVGGPLVVVDARGHLDAEEVMLTLDLLPQLIAEDAITVLTDGDLSERLVPGILAKFEDRKIALAAAMPVFRPLVAREVIAKTSVQNGAIATISFIPGADMPILTINQLKMVLELMAVYGQEPSLGRLKEILAVIGGGFVFRALARELLDFLPGPGWLIKGGVAAGGTAAVGKAAQSYLELGKGGPIEPLASGGEAAVRGREARTLH